jgi:NAD(P)-dependent dehydrogenase (short-subunit alcohol dehydrogenase family)
VSFDLTGKVALVAGASKGIGKGIALELGACGATVYVTGRTMEPAGDNPGLLAAAAEIDALGGRGVAVQCDHRDDCEVEGVFERIGDDHGALDVLVNNASPDFSAMVGHRFWDIPFTELDSCLAVGPRSMYVATTLAVRQMLPRRAGLVVNVSSHGSEDYILSVPYGIGKAGIDKLTHDGALELREHGIAIVSIWPGLVLTERIMAGAVPGPDGKLRLAGLDIDVGESPRFSGRGVAALATDPDVMARSGRCFAVSTLAREYGFTDLDGHTPPEVRNLASYLGEENVPSFWKIVDPFPNLGASA